MQIDQAMGRLFSALVASGGLPAQPAMFGMFFDDPDFGGEEARDFPLYCRRQLSFFPGAAVHDVSVELFLPLK
jgi:DNA gyrase inhibitor GyrI